MKSYIRYLSVVTLLLPGIVFSEYFTNVGYAKYGPYNTVAEAATVLKANAKYGEHLTQLSMRSDAHGNEVYTYGFEDQPAIISPWYYRSPSYYSSSSSRVNYLTEEQAINDYKNFLLSNPKYCTVASITPRSEYATRHRGVCPWPTHSRYAQVQTQLNYLDVISTYDISSNSTQRCVNNNYTTNLCRYRSKTCPAHLQKKWGEDICVRNHVEYVWGKSTASFSLYTGDIVSLSKDANVNTCSIPSTYTTYPINTTNGNKYRNELDFTQAGLSPLKLSRYYSSNKNQTYDVGVNWRHSYTASLTTNIHSATQPYVAGDSNFSSLNSSAQLACESGWNDIKGTYSQPELSSSSTTYVNNTCSIQDTNGNALGSIAVRDNSTGGVSANPPQDTIVIERANGNTIIFTSINSVWTAPSDTDVSLVQTTTGYTLTTAQDTVEQYNLTGQLISTTTRKGLQETLAYNATTNLLEAVTDTFGNSLTFRYSGSNLVTVTLPDNKTLSYLYDAANNLISVKREDNTTRTYHYEDARFVNSLTGITDGNNQRHMTFTYDALGRAVSSELGDGVSLSAEKVTVDYIDDATSTVTDALGLKRTYRFATINGEKKLVDIEGAPCSSCGGQATHTTYDVNGYVASSTDFNGNVTTYINNSRGLATTRIDATGTTNERVTTIQWHATYSLPTKVTQVGNITDLAYDVQGNVLSRTQTDTTNNKVRTVTTTYNNFSQVLTVDGTRTDVSDITTYTYDAKGNLATVTNALGHTTQITNYDLRNRPLTLIDANGLTTELSYDVRGRVASRTVKGSGNSLTTTFSYDGGGNLKSVNLPDAKNLTYDYDAAHRLVGISDQLGNRISYNLDALGNRLSENVTDPSNTLVRTRSQVFNMLSQLTKNIGAQNQTTEYGYDLNGNRLTTTDAATNSTTSAFDALNRVISITDPLNGDATYGYDNQGNLVSVKDANGVITTYTYDGFGNRINQTSLATGVTSYTYDEAGNVLSHTDAKAQTTTYTYDALHRLILTTYDDGSTVTYSYDHGVNQLGRLTAINTNSVTNGTSSLTYGYDVLGRMATKTQSVNGINLTTAYAYDFQGQLSSMTYPSGLVVEYSYANGQLTGIRVNGETLINTINYEAFGAVKGWTWGNGSIHSRGYDLDGQLISQSLASETRTLGYDVKGNITAIQNTSNSINHVFGYDELNRLTAANDATFSQSFNYDANGNRLSLTEATATDTYGYDASNTNRLMSITGAVSKTYQYDANGNIINDGSHGFTYDARNRLVTVNGDDAVYQFNALGQRIYKKIKVAVSDYASLASTLKNQVGKNISETKRANKPNGTNSNSTQGSVLLETLFSYNESGQLIGEYDQDGVVQQDVIYLGQTPIASVRKGVVYYIHSDHIGTPRMITDNTNTTIWSWNSDPFGKTAANDDPDNNKRKFIFNLRFAGQYYDAETGLHYNYFRDYDPSTGRYVQSDPIGLGGGLNTYGYVGGNPLSYIDPYGLCTGQFGLPCGFGLWKDVKNEAPLVRDAIVEGSTNGLLAATTLAGGVGLIPKVVRGFALLSEASVLSEISIEIGFALRNGAITTYEASACAVNKTIVAGTSLASAPLLQNNQKNILDYISSLFPGAPTPSPAGYLGGIIGSQTNPHEKLR